MARITDPHESEREQAVQPNGKTILLAEDDPFISRMYQTKLDGGGFKVVSVNNGRDAYEQIKVLQPDLIMLDINMPELSGFDVVRGLMTDDASFDPNKVVILTNSANPADRQTATELGLDYMVKAEMTPHDVLNDINKKLGLPTA